MDNFDPNNADTYNYGRIIRSTIQPRNVIIQRSAAGFTGSSMMIERSSKYSNALSMPLLGLAGSAGPGVAEIKSSRDKEKRDMQDLNERFASYIEKVRFLEAQNRKLGDELDRLKTKWGKETNNIKLMYQTELDEAKKLLDDSERDRQKLQIRVAALEEQLDALRRKLQEVTIAAEESREKMERQVQQLADYEAEVNLLKRRIALLEGDRDINKKTLSRLQESLNRARTDLDNESILHQDAENRRVMLEEELEFLKQVHEQELRELAALAYRDTTLENRELWKSEMSTSLRGMQTLYDTKIDDMRNEMDTLYTMKIQEYRTGATKQNLDSAHSKEEMVRLRTQYSDLQSRLYDLKSRNDMIQREIDEIRRDKEETERDLNNENSRLINEVAKLKAEMESISRELQDLLDAKLGLELEIAAYRKLLEGEEDRVGLRQVVDSMFTTMTAASGGGGGDTGAYNISQTSYTKGANSASSGGLIGDAGNINIQRSSMTSNYQTRNASSVIGGSTSGGAYASSFGTTYGENALNVNQVVKGDMLAKTTYQRSAKGPIAIVESDGNGKFICIENSGRREELLNNWTIRRNVDGKEMPIATLPVDFRLNPGAKIKIFCRGARSRDASPFDIELFNCSTFGQGHNITTRLCNNIGEERATQVQKTVFA